METPSQQAQLAVLIDADNANAKRIDALLAEVSKYGRATTKRAYGDWTNTHLGSWKQTLARHAIQPMQQFSNTRGKNSTDSALIIDAMDLLYTERFDGFCIVSSDSDFTRLASRIREAGLTVYGFGERKTPQPFVRACDRFIYVEVLGQDSVDDEVTTAAPASANGSGNGGGERGRRGRRGGGGQKAANADGGARAATAPAAAEPVAAVEPEVAADAAPVEPPVAVAATPSAPRSGGTIDDPALLLPLRAAVADLGDDDGWAGLGAVGSLISKRIPEFDPRNWGKKKLSDLFLAISSFEVDERGEPGRSRQLFVRERRQGLAPGLITDTAPAAERPRTPERGGQPRPPRDAQGARPAQPPRPAPSPRPQPVADEAADEAGPAVAGWAPRRDDRRPTWAITPEPIVAPVPAAAEPAAVIVEPVALAAAVPDAEPVASATEPVVAEAAADPAPARSARKSAPRKAAARKTATQAAPAAADAPAAAPKKRSRAVKKPAA